MENKIMSTVEELNKNPHWKDPNWKYYPACSSDIRRTFEKFKSELANKQIKIKKESE